MNIICLILEKTNTWMILYAQRLMSSNKWTYILGIFCEDEIHVSKESGGLTKIKRGSFKRKLVILSSKSARLHVEIERGHKDECKLNGS
jgi:hypothetical protein